MLGNCVIRNPLNGAGAFDKGALCEALLFFGKVHLAIDLSTLAGMVHANFLEDLIRLLEAGHLTANYSPQFAGLRTDTKHGLQEHIFVLVKLMGQSGKQRSPQTMQEQLHRLLSNAHLANSFMKRLERLVSFDDIEAPGLSELGRDDISNHDFAMRMARLALLEKGVPEEEIRFRQLEILSLGDGKFTIVTDLDVNRLRRFLPEADRATFGSKDLFAGIADARVDILIAAQQNAALIGNEKNQIITDLILRSRVGTKYDPDIATRQIYDFISVTTPTIREVINSEERSVSEFLTLFDRADAFKKWFVAQNPSADLIREMLREKAATGWLETTPVKVARFGLFTGGGMLTDVFAPGSSVAVGAIDAFLIERWSKRWRPHFFVENELRGFLDAKSS
jgi:hypothetical protein